MFFLKSPWKHSKNNSPLLSDRNQRPQTRASPPVIEGDGLKYTPHYTPLPRTILPPFHSQRRPDEGSFDQKEMETLQF